MAVDSIARPHSEVGPGIDAMKAEEARMILKDIPPRAVYQENTQKIFPYEILQRHDIVKKVVDLWLQRRENIERICAPFQQPIPNDATDLLTGYAPIRLRPLPKPGRLREGLSSYKHETIILIALGNLDRSNGLFFDGVEMKSGEDIAVNGAEELRFSGNGGGLAILLFLNLAWHTKSSKTVRLPEDCPD